MVETRASTQEESAADLAAQMVEAAVERAKRKAISKLDVKLPTRMKKVKRAWNAGTGKEGRAESSRQRTLAWLAGGKPQAEQRTVARRGGGEGCTSPLLLHEVPRWRKIRGGDGAGCRPP
ncbi:unnamed protein product [Ectocarpus sp. 8 AP-2014]